MLSSLPSVLINFLLLSMATHQNLNHILNRIDGRGYPAYKDIRGTYDFPAFTLFIDHVQGDPFAEPSRMRVRVPMRRAVFPEVSFSSTRRIALRDYIARIFSMKCREASDLSLGSGKSGLIAMARPGQEILERSSVMVTCDHVEARFGVGLPAQGRRIRGRQAAEMLCRDVPRIVDSALMYGNLDAESLKNHLDTAEDADTLRDHLREMGLVAFVVDGSILPRLSGIDDRPMHGDHVVRFRSPVSLRVEVTLPHRGQVEGTGIPTGVTLIVGGGYHGKSTLLSALERGVYNHIPGDGRELVLADPAAVKIRAEDGRRVEGVDLRLFINNLPDGRPAHIFRTDNASGSTSQAASIIEALEMNAHVLVLDEDTCATNLMIRDARMQALVEKKGEPITPFIDRVRSLGVSSVMVLGGSGDYFDVADTVIRMDRYLPMDVTTEAVAVAKQYPTGRKPDVMEATTPKGQFRRIPVAESLDPSMGRREVNIKGRALRAVLFGTEEIDVSAVAQLVDEGQVRAIGQALNLARERFMQPDRDLAAVVVAVMQAIAQEGLDVLDTRCTGDYVAFRPFELAAALNRLRTLRVMDVE